MQKFTRLTVAAADVAYLPIANIDTDMIIPKQYLKTIKRSGLGRWLFAGSRYDPSGKPVADFVLNPQPGARLILAGENFGCGSSREHAPWSLLDFGIRAVIAPSFADIFYGNSIKNGLLPVKLSKESVAALAESREPVTVDLEEQAVVSGALRFGFSLEPGNRTALLQGLDEIESILAHRAETQTYETAHFARQPWLKRGTHA